MPITATGYERRTQADILTAIQDAQRSTISAKLDLSERTVLGSLNPIFAEHVDQLEQLVEECYSAFDPDNASDDRFVALCLLTGVPRRGATKGLVTATVNLEASKSYAAGDLVAHVTDQPTNRWLNRDAVASTTAGNYSAVFESEFASSVAVAPAGTLTVIASPVDGWNSITNADDATAGTDIEDIEALRLRREQAVSLGGSRTRNAIRAAIVSLDGVLSCEVFENVTSATDGNGLPPHSFRAVVWDGPTPAADDDEIAQAIYDRKAEGIVSDGGESGTAQDDVVGPVTVNFERATQQAIAVEVNIISAAGVSIDDVKAAIIAQMPTRVGDGVTYNRLTQSVFDVEGVDDWDLFEIDGGTSSLPEDISLIFTLDESDITVTGDVS
jgi:uncharacterized phage protein gp47/JayE